MIRLGSFVFCATLGMGAALFACSSSDGGGGAGGSGTGGGLPGTGGLLSGTGGAAAGAGTGGAVPVSGTGGAGGAGLTGTAAVLAILPKDDPAGWTRDPSESKVKDQPAALALDFKAAEILIDGGADPFYTPDYKPNVFAWQNYMNMSLNPPEGYFIRMYLLQMPSATQAAALYTALVDGTHSLYTSIREPWDTTLAIGDAARIVNSGTDWWINFRKGVYYVETSLSYAEKTDLVGKQQVIDFATAIANKM